MKKQTFRKIGTIAIFSMFLLSVLSMFGVFALPSISKTGLILGNVIAAAAQTSTGAVTTAITDSASPHLLMDDIAKDITKMKPDTNPLDTIIRNIEGATDSISSWEYRYYSVGTRGVEDTIVTSSTSSSVGAASTAKVMTVGNGKLWQVDDLCLVDGKYYTAISGAPSIPGQLVCLVTNVSGDDVTMLALNTGTGINKEKMPVIANGTKITNIGNAKHELDAKTEAYNIFPIDEENYVQIHMSMVEASFYDKMLKKEVNWDINDMAALSLYAYRQRCELTSLFGTKYKYTDSAGKMRWMTGGITRYITNKTEYDPNNGVNDAWFNKLAKDTFSGNNGSDTRILFASPDFMEVLMNAPTVTKQIEAKATEIVHGVRFNRIETAFGNFLVKMHKVLRYVPDYSNRAIILDMNYIEKKELKPLTTTHLELKKTGISNSDAILLDEAFCLITRFPDVHRIIVPTGEKL